MTSSNVIASESLQLGSSARIAISCSDIRSSLSFYTTLGFRVVAIDSGASPSFARLSDGAIVVTLLSEHFKTPALAYFTANLQQTYDALQHQNVEVQVKQNEKGEITEAHITSLEGISIWLHRQLNTATPLPTGNRNTVCGTFGEFAIGVADLEASIAYWEHLGFRVVHQSDILYPFAIMSDGLINIGLHNNQEIKAPALTYFAKDMADRIEWLKKQGIHFIVEFPPGPDGRVANAVAQAPDGQLFYLFEGNL